MTRHLLPTALLLVVAGGDAAHGQGAPARPPERDASSRPTAPAATPLARLVKDLEARKGAPTRVVELLAQYVPGFAKSPEHRSMGTAATVKVVPVEQDGVMGALVGVIPWGWRRCVTSDPPTYWLSLVRFGAGPEILAFTQGRTARVCQNL